MEIKISDRIVEGQSAVRETLQELGEYDLLVMAVRALSAVTNHPDKFTYNKDDYDMLESRIRKICEKHEIRLPEFVEWGSIEFT